MKRFLHYANIPYHIANHVVGAQHTQQHRRTAGFVVMFVGVAIAHATQHLGLSTFLALFGDLVGYSIHATGFLPYVHDIENTNQKTINNEPNNQ